MEPSVRGTAGDAELLARLDQALDVALDRIAGNAVNPVDVVDDVTRFDGTLGASVPKVG